MQELEHWRTKFDVASGATEGFFSKRWIAENMFGLTPEEMLRIQREMFADKKFEALLEHAVEKTTEEAAASAPSIGGGDEELGEDELGGEEEGEDLGGDELGGDEPGADDAAAEGGEEDTGALLAAPKRDTEGPPRWRAPDGTTTTKASKGKWYKPVRDDKRDMGARKRSYSTFGGYKDLKSLSKGITESDDSTYNEEQQILQSSNEIRKLIKEMESKNNEPI